MMNKIIGQSVAMQKYVPVDLLLIPKKASTLEEAVTAIRICDRQCSLIENQAHCIKNKKFLIVTAIEHVFTQVCDFLYRFNHTFTYNYHQYIVFNAF